MKRLAILFCLFSILFSACKDDTVSDENYSAIVTGTLFDSCNGSPISNLEIKFIDAGSSGNVFQDGAPGLDLGVFTTNENGKFEVKLSQRLAANYAYITTIDRRILFFGEVLENELESNDIGILYLNSMKIPVKLKLTINNDQWNMGQTVALAQRATDKTLVYDTAINTQSKRGIMYHDWYAYFYEKISEDVATDSFFYRGIIGARSGSKNASKEIRIQSCDLDSLGIIGLHLK